MGWYESLNKSKLTPPNYVFSIAWSILYFMIFLSFIFYVKDKPSNTGLALFTIQLILNLSWAPIFFSLKKPTLALIIIIIMWIFILATIINFYKTNRTSCYLLMPYFIWVSFATYLNFFIVINNKV
jgi:benzodiazapine receptor